MNLLLDTHIVLWALADDAALARPARAAILDRSNRVLVSAATAWEVAIKRALGKLRAPDDFEAALESSGFESLSITTRHALRAGALPAHHDDPFDRMLVAQALEESMVMVTVDPRFADYGVTLFES